MSENPEPEATQNHEKKDQFYLSILTFYNTHFPTDKKTYRIRIPVLGLVLSMLSFNFVTSFLWVEYFAFHRVAVWSFVILAAAAAWEMYWGFRIGDKKQFAPWIILKIIEIAMVLAEIIDAIVKYSNHFDDIIGDIILALFVLIFNCYLLYVIISKTRKNRIEMDGGDSDENIYEDPNQQGTQYANA